MKRIYNRIILVCVAFLFSIIVTEQTRIFAYADTNVDYDNLGKQLDEDIEKYHIPGMAIVVVDSDEVLFAEIYGNCDSIDYLLSLAP